MGLLLGRSRHRAQVASEASAAAPDAISYGVDTIQEDVKSLVDIGKQVDVFERRAGV
jgi:hypothetical protein